MKINYHLLKKQEYVADFHILRKNHDYQSSKKSLLLFLNFLMGYGMQIQNYSIEKFQM